MFLANSDVKQRKTHGIFKNAYHYTSVQFKNKSSLAFKFADDKDEVLHLSSKITNLF
jgi:hypothetical protein